MPRDALQIAEDLLSGAENEAKLRAATSRAYMAAFQHLIKHPMVAFTKTGKGDDHRLLIQHLQKSNDDPLNKIGYRYLPRLRALRNRADYSLDVSFTKGMAEDALERATEIIYELLP